MIFLFTVYKLNYNGIKRSIMPSLSMALRVNILYLTQQQQHAFDGVRARVAALIPFSL
jgi:hypothetical protein